LAELQEQRDAEIRAGVKADRREKQKADKMERLAKEEEAKLRSYS
jgi:hypothetical protein